MALWRKPAPPPVIGVLTGPPPPPTWWQSNRHLVLLAIGVIAGFWLAVKFGVAADATPACPPGLRPAHTASPTPAPTGAQH
ncbi:hypothetical protein [Kitasatospora sp. NPDC001175]|uniref:hypothetical protein n=1 Tax=Kitasatospora sp. NPDC001175 TaxID=3157103 RepID=UPI003D08B780